MIAQFVICAQIHACPRLIIENQAGVSILYTIRFYPGHEGHGITGYRKVIARAKMLAARGTFERPAGVGIRTALTAHFDEVGKGLCLPTNREAYRIQARRTVDHLGVTSRCATHVGSPRERPLIRSTV